MARGANMSTIIPKSSLPWVYGSWQILEQDREAQRQGKPYWTLRPPNNYGANCIASGPIGRKSMNPEEIICPIGYEVEGLIFADDEDLEYFLEKINAID